MLFDNKLKADKKNIHAIFMNDSQLGIKYGLLQTEHLLGMHTASFASFVRDRVTSMLLTHFRKTYVPFLQDSGKIRVRMCWIKRPINIFETFNFKEIA